MGVSNADFSFRNEELVPLAKLLRDQYTQDEADFVDLLPRVYTKNFLPDYDVRLKAADAVVSAKLGQGQSAAFGARMAETQAALPALLNRLEARARRAEGLTVPLKALGVQAVRDAYKLQDRERLDTALKLLLRNLDDNAAALDDTGHTPAETAKLRTLHQSLMSDSAAQDASQTNSQRLTAANVTVLNHLYAAMQHVLKDGKSLYRGVDAARLKGYTVKELLKRVRQTRGDTGEA
ncbi:hypothetical protein [Hymenobacter chitinivorans]|uniref:Uncharacterized protein n=1 Tax=Hymenobacter chitinivorans DSM 11115 TaxID=1121954 RepID=A0A2M9ASQ6_9BACT|nr:hypothetical protein [Hymenobacter chitinivorans]PJJ48745.1 hypothetical protein CLV45_4455 [Hymenobacter chitinivorans DSM 11115]